MVILGLGSNLNNRIHYLRQAVELIKESVLTSVTCSPCYHSPALLPENAPESWDAPFLNIAISGHTALTPHALLSALKTIELRVGRAVRPLWAPREIDIDILSYDDLILDTPTLQIPHKELANRTFALSPLADLAPNWIHPILHQSAHDLRKALAKSDQGVTHMTMDTI